MAIRIIDTSKWQNSKVDYAKAKKAGYVGVMLRVGCNKTIDKCFENDYAAAIAAGLKVGVYFYTHSTTPDQARADADRVLGWLDGRHLDLPVAYDIEHSTQKSTGRKTANAQMYNAFANRMRTRSSYDVMLYTGESFFNSYFNKDLITDKLWIAKYSTKAPSVGRDVYMWQYTSSADASDFYTGNLDRSYFYGELEEDAAGESQQSNPYPEPTRTIKRTIPTMTGNDVAWVQYELREAGFDKSFIYDGKKYPAVEIDGKCGSTTSAAIGAYQLKYGLKHDKKCGPATRYHMKEHK